MRPLTVALAALLSSCSDPTPAPVDAAADKSDGGVDVAPSDVVVITDVLADLPEAGGLCSFNRDCADGLRCECHDATGCQCLAGARGTGINGETACASGEDCASAVCLDGTTGMLCSGECQRDTDCPTALPRCLTVPTLGSICTRRVGGADASVDAPAGCMGECASTTLRATFGTRVAGFERAQHGRSGSDGVYVEAHAGGDPACPNERSPTPMRTLALRGMRNLAVGVAQTEADGVTAILFDFSGALTSRPLVRATAVRVVPRAVMPGNYVSLDVTATFDEGTLRGGLFAPHCASLD